MDPSGLTEEEFLALPECKGMFAIWVDPGDPRCGWIIKKDWGIQWSIGKARINEKGEWDPKENWQLVRQYHHQ
jgi:hypothetical protein